MLNKFGKVGINHDTGLKFAPEASLVLVFGGLFEGKEQLQVSFVDVALCIWVDLDVIVKELGSWVNMVNRLLVPQAYVLLNSLADLFEQTYQPYFL